MSASAAAPSRGPAKSAELGSLGAYHLQAIARSMGSLVTYRAAHDVIGRNVWITAAPASVEPSVTLNERLLHAARVLADAGFEPVLGLLEIIQHDGRVAVVTEAPLGLDLRELSNRAARTALDAEESLAVAYAIGRAVAQLHERGIVHLALAPEHVFLEEQGRVRLSALWDARVIGARAPVADRDLPDAGPEGRYRSPERIKGDEVTRASDVFSLGVIAYELVTGRHPFEDERKDTSMARRIRTAEPPPPEARDAIGQVIQRCMNKLPLLRYESAARFCEDAAVALGSTARAEALASRAIARLHDKPGAQVGARSDAALWRLGRRLALVAGAMLLVMIFVALGDERMLSGSSGVKGATSAQVRVLARPWADIYVDGERVETTPIGRPIELPPGRHEIVLRHPRAEDQRRLVTLGAGETITIDVDMDVKRPVDAGGDGSP